jgi:hypothetical protein
MILQLSKSIILLVLIITVTSCTRKQENATSNIRKVSDNLYKKEGGWQLPDLSQFKIREPRHQTKMLPDKPVKVYETIYDPTDSDRVVMIYPLSNESKSFETEILQLTVYDWNERTFSYVLQTTPYAPPGGARVTTVSYFSYYDEDGDGKFETLDTTALRRNPLHTPEWVLQN